jgi:hypothetical protein
MEPSLKRLTSFDLDLAAKIRMILIISRHAHKSGCKAKNILLKYK